MKRLTPHFVGTPVDKFGCLTRVAGEESVFYRVGKVAVGLVPLAGPPVQFGSGFVYPTGCARSTPQSFGEKIGKEMMIPIPLPAIVERHEKQVGPCQAAQDLVPIGRPGDRVA